MNPQNYLNQLWNQGQNFLNVKIPILGGAMTWVSNYTLVSAISNAGGFGILACGAMTPDLLKKEIKATQVRTKEPFGVNLITLHPQLLQLIDVCITTGVSHVILAGGLPSKQAIDALKKANTKAICFAPALSLAKRLIKQGVDALIIEGHEAGGHVGPVSTNILAQEILPAIREVPIFVAGGIGRGEMILSFLEMGAAGCQLGTRFVCAQESPAHPRFKQAFINAAARDAIVSPQLDPRFPVIPVRALENAGTKHFIEFQHQMVKRVGEGEEDLKEAQLKIEHYWAGALRKAVIEGNIEEGSLMAGQSVGFVTREQSAQEIIDELVAQALHTLTERRVASALR
jgi:enoyl-[acyl-carrier protein] reductase II